MNQTVYQILLLFATVVSTPADAQNRGDLEVGNLAPATDPVLAEQKCHLDGRDVAFSQLLHHYLLMEERFTA